VYIKVLNRFLNHWKLNGRYSKTLSFLVAISLTSFTVYCRIRSQKTDWSTGENHSSSDTSPEDSGDQETSQLSISPGTALSIRFVVRRGRPNVEGLAGRDEEELDQYDGPATDDTDAADKSDGGDEVNDDTPGQEDWIIVISHADNTIRFRNIEASYLAGSPLHCTVMWSYTVSQKSSTSYFAKYFRAGLTDCKNFNGYRVTDNKRTQVCNQCFNC